MSKLSNIKRALDAQLPFQERLSTVAEAAGCTLEQGDFVMWGGVTVAISTSRGDWETGDITEYLLINILLFFTMIVLDVPPSSKASPCLDVSILL